MEKRLTKLNSVYLDTSVFIYIQEDYGDFSKKARDLARRLEKQSTTIVSSSILLTELLQNKNVQASPINQQIIKSNFFDTPNLIIQSVDICVAELGAIISSRYNLKIPDSIHLGTAILHTCDFFITNDKKLKRVNEIEVLILSEL